MNTAVTGRVTVAYLSLNAIERADMLKSAVAKVLAGSLFD